MGDITTLKNNTPITIIQSLADRPILATTSALKAKFDESPDDLRGLLNTLIDYLLKNNAADDGASNIGINSPYGSTVKALIEYILSQGSGNIPADGSLTTSKFAASAFSTDGTMADNSDTKLSSQKAIKTYSDTKVGKNIFTAAGDILYSTADSTPTKLSVNGALKALITNSGNNAPQWADSLQSLLLAQGDMIVASAANTPIKLSLGTSGKSPVSNGTTLVYGYPDVQYYQASDTVILTANTERSTNSTSYATLKSFNLKHSGIVRIKLQSKNSSGSYPYYIAVDGVQVLYTTNTSYADFSTDLNLGIGNHVIQIKTDNASETAYIRNLTINADLYVPTNSIVD